MYVTEPLDRKSAAFENAEQLKPLIAEAGVVICGTDNRPSKLLINQLCVEAGVVAVYGGAFRRAYGGQPPPVCRVGIQSMACQP